MRPLARLTSLLPAIALLCACSAIHNATQAAQDSFHSGFRKSFKSGFMKSCSADGASDKLCGCVEATLERKYTDDQLMKMAGDSDESRWQLQAATRACTAKR
jgi:hypothetical protein